MALNGHSPKHLHRGRGGGGRNREMRGKCSQNVRACRIFNPTPCLSEALSLSCIQNESHQWPILRERQGKKLRILLLACHCGVEIIIVFFWSPELSHLLHKTMAIFFPCSVFPSLSFIFILLHYNLKLWQCYSPWGFFLSSPLALIHDCYLKWPFIWAPGSCLNKETAWCLSSRRRGRWGPWSCPHLLPLSPTCKSEVSLVCLSGSPYPGIF